MPMSLKPYRPIDSKPRMLVDCRSAIFHFGPFSWSQRSHFWVLPLKTGSNRFQTDSWPSLWKFYCDIGFYLTLTTQPFVLEISTTAASSSAFYSGSKNRSTFDPQIGKLYRKAPRSKFQKPKFFYVVSLVSCIKWLLSSKPFLVNFRKISEMSGKVG